MHAPGPVQQMMGNGQSDIYGPGMMGGSGSGMMGGGQQSPTAQGTPTTGVTHLTIRQYAYQPATIQVTVGTTVTWTNQDNVPHSVTLKNGMADSGLLKQGQFFSYTFQAAGTYQYYCTVHPYMTGTVIVTQN